MATIEGIQIELVDSSFKDSNGNQVQALMQPVNKTTPLLDVKQNQHVQYNVISNQNFSKVRICCFDSDLQFSEQSTVLDDPSFVITPLTTTNNYYYANVNYYFVTVIGGV